MTSEQYLWAKMSPSENKWLPLAVHMSDTAAVASYLWETWVSDTVKNQIQQALDQSDSGIRSIDLVKFFAASHDIGKASPAFQAKALASGGSMLCERVIQNGLKIKDNIDIRTIPHAAISLAIMERNGIDRSVSIVAGSHHGVPPSRDLVSRRKLSGYTGSTGFSDPAWIGVQDSLLMHACELSGISKEQICGLRLSEPGQDIMTGVVIISDWLASNEQFFPLIGFDRLAAEDGSARAEQGCARIAFPHHEGLVYSSDMSFQDAFSFPPRDFQKLAMDMAVRMDRPGLVVIEAPMGEGKTEAALAIAEILASKFGQNGLFFGLPTQATANCVFSRVKDWVEKCSKDGTRSISLAHGKSAFNEEFSSIPRSGWDVDGRDGNVVVHQWFHGKTGLLSDIVVGTVDQVLMAGLKRRHLFLRHFGLAEKVVIIDECHAYDEYMGSYLQKSLNWLGALGVPVIVMSATLPPKRKTEMINAYANAEVDVSRQADGYPMITCLCGTSVDVGTSGASGRDMTVSVCRISMDDVVEEVGAKLRDGGHAGIIVNTVRHAQDLYEAIKAIYPDDVMLLHSAFTAADRARLERKLLDSMARKGGSEGKRVIVVGTQVLEQSLDIDFDIMFTEICPIDLLLQRMGRLHRHENQRPAGMESPICYVIDAEGPDFDRGTESVYGRYQLMNTRVLLGDEVRIPQDVPGLVRSAYSPGGVAVPGEMSESYEAAKAERDSAMERKERKAKVYQVAPPRRNGDLTGWLDNERSGMQEQCAEATVRDIDGSVEVVMVCRDADGRFAVFGDSEACLDASSVPDPRIARMISDCRIALPHRLVSKHGLDKVIDAVAASNKDAVPKPWRESEWLADELMQVVDEDGRFELLGVKMRYDSEKGLMME